jgi:hypothetical protein
MRLSDQLKHMKIRSQAYNTAGIDAWKEQPWANGARGYRLKLKHQLNNSIYNSHFINTTVIISTKQPSIKQTDHYSDP